MVRSTVRAANNSLGRLTFCFSLRYIANQTPKRATGNRDWHSGIQLGNRWGSRPQGGSGGGPGIESATELHGYLLSESKSH